MKRIILFVLCLPLYSLAQSGSVTGNVFWKYNNFIGNKADAASQAWLYADSSTKPQEATCDLQGNFKFDNLKPGDYLLIVKSKNTTDDWRYNFIELRFAPLAHYLGSSFAPNKMLFDSVDFYSKSYEDARLEKVSVWNPNKHQKKIDRLKAQYVACVRKIFATVPTTIKPYFDLELSLDYPRKIFIKEISVQPGQTIPIVVDFGVTYL